MKIRLAFLVLSLMAAAPVRAEYLRIQLKVFGLDCEICARGVSASVGRLAGVENVQVSLKTGMLHIALKPGNTFRLSDLRKRIRENGFRSMEATVTAIGQRSGSKIEVAGAGESQTVPGPDTKVSGPEQLTFEVR
jgi:cation transport ATPase